MTGNMDAHSPRAARRAAVVLVAASALGGVVACGFGALQWGFLGLSLGLAGAWAFFLLGLFGLYHREQRQPAVVEFTAQPADLQTAARE